ncbi:hypothetical protein GW758_01745 [Candidatus Falkowbacteria bacterium]|nr:hypothetical protein [Candidatus Falkowbacteria bacterium]NCT54665.1 hypothetical protein [Candidatus Falkowbacteria bacterium]
MIAKKKQGKDFSLKNQKESGLASFVARPIPEEGEIIDFEKAVNRELRDQEIDSHLIDVYSDKKGGRVDVSHMNIKKKPKFFLSLLKNIIFVALLVALVNFVYNQYFRNDNDISSLKLELIAPERVVAGEEFYYEVEYFNPSKFVFSEIYLEMQYPDNFIFDSATLNSIPVLPENGNYAFKLETLDSGERASLKIKGYILNLPESVNLAVARLTYLPGTFSSHFKKEDSSSTIIRGLGFLVDTESSNAIFINQENEIKIFFSGFDDGLLTEKLSEFDIFFDFSDGSGGEILGATSSLSLASNEELSEEKLSLEKLSAFSWHIANLSSLMNRQETTFKYRVKNKVDAFQVNISLRHRLSDKEYVFWQKTLKPELVSSDLSLNLILNDSSNDQALNFGSDLNYSLHYSNKGTKAYQDVVIMAILEGEVLDFDSLVIGQNGERSANSIVWSKNELPALREIKAGTEGEINFNIKVKDFNSNFLGKNLELSAHAQYSVGGKEISGAENISNKIINKINSDLNLKEELRYFNDDNYPVGSGPLPPEVNQKTEFRVYWTIENNLHELRELKATFNLPAYVNFTGRQELEVGSLYYDDDLRQVVWEIGLLPTSKYLLQGSFYLSVTPTDNDRDKILVLSPGSIVSAIDTETGGVILSKTEPKTSRLEDDDIAQMNNSGRVK